MTARADRSPAAGRLALLLAKHGPELARHLRRIVRDDDAAEDLLQDTMLRAHRALPRLAPGSNARAWLYRIATNAALNHVRSRAREGAALRRHAAEHAAPTPAFQDGRGEEDGRRGALWAEVARLPARQRLVITLRLTEELSYDEIARRLGGTPAAARANAYQATRTLRRRVRNP